MTAIAADAGVSRQTVYTWLARHGLEPAASATKPRPAPEELVAMYDRLGSALSVAGELLVSRDTARRWLHGAGVDLRRTVDLKEARRRRAEGASFAQIAAEQGVGAETVRRHLRSRPE